MKRIIAKDLDTFLDWVCLQLPNEDGKEAMKCLERNKKGEAWVRLECALLNGLHTYTKPYLEQPGYNDVCRQGTSYFPGWTCDGLGAILIFVTLILLFGEIIPQSVCTRYGLAIGAYVAAFMRVLPFQHSGRSFNKN
ncbi:DUF21 domain-containing protein-like protein isoform X4 [Tanacetum coccineum]